MSDIFPSAVYLLCFATSSACALLLARNYRRTRARLLLWSALCFLFLALNNLVVMIDLLLLPDVDLQIPRLALSLGAVGLLLFGCIWDLEE
ncbi:MAG TPA: DUF5985 family protein [Allosphingosinicella sp.]|nr:DUF5985 family protein [Allosphingosinicella sp.]